MPDIKDSIREALVDLIEELTDVGIVHNRTKFSADWTVFLNNFGWVDTAGRNQVRGWWLSIPTMPSIGRGTYNSDSEIYTFVVRGIMSYKDSEESEPVFQELIYRVFRHLQKQSDLDVGIVGNDYFVDGSIVVTMPTVELRQYGSVLCHYCEIHFVCEVISPYP